MRKYLLLYLKADSDHNNIVARRNLFYHTVTINSFVLCTELTKRRVDIFSQSYFLLLELTNCVHILYEYGDQTYPV